MASVRVLGSRMLGMCRLVIRVLGNPMLGIRMLGMSVGHWCDGQCYAGHLYVAWVGCLLIIVAILCWVFVKYAQYVNLSNIQYVHPQNVN